MREERGSHALCRQHWEQNARSIALQRVAEGELKMLYERHTRLLREAEETDRRIMQLQQQENERWQDEQDVVGGESDTNSDGGRYSGSEESVEWQDWEEDSNREQLAVTMTNLRMPVDEVGLHGLLEQAANSQFQVQSEQGGHQRYRVGTGRAWVQFSEVADAAKAVRRLDGCKLNGRKVKLRRGYWMDGRSQEEEEIIIGAAVGEAVHLEAV